MPPQGAPVTIVGSGGGTSSQAVQGASANGSPATGFPVQVAGSDGANTRTINTDTAGRINANVMSGGVAIGATATNADAVATSATANSLRVSSYSLIFNGTTFDRQRKTSLYSRIASTAAGGSPTVLKSSAGEMRGFWGQNGAAITYLQIYNKATAPVLGTDTPVMTYPIPANTVFAQNFGDGAYLAAGVSFAFTTDAAGATGAAAGAVTSFSMMGS